MLQLDSQLTFMKFLLHTYFAIYFYHIGTNKIPITIFQTLITTFVLQMMKEAPSIKSKATRVETYRNSVYTKDQQKYGLGGHGAEFTTQTFKFVCWVWQRRKLNQDLTLRL